MVSANHTKQMVLGKQFEIPILKSSFCVVKLAKQMVHGIQFEIPILKFSFCMVSADPAKQMVLGTQFEVMDHFEARASDSSVDLSRDGHPYS